MHILYICVFLNAVLPLVNNWWLVATRLFFIQGGVSFCVNLNVWQLGWSKRGGMQSKDAWRRYLRTSMMCSVCSVPWPMVVWMCVLYCDPWWCECVFCTVTHGVVNVCSLLWTMVVWMCVLYCDPWWCECVFCTVTHGGVNVCSVLWPMVVWMCVLYCDPWWCECVFCTVTHGGVNVCSVLWPMVVWMCVLYRDSWWCECVLYCDPW